MADTAIPDSSGVRNEEIIAAISMATDLAVRSWCRGSLAVGVDQIDDQVNGLCPCGIIRGQDEFAVYEFMEDRRRVVSPFEDHEVDVVTGGAQIRRRRPRTATRHRWGLPPRRS